MLQIAYDIADALITDPGLSILDPVSSFLGTIKASGPNCPYFLTPGNTSLMLRPYQLMTNWPSTTKFRLADYGSPSGWEEQQVRASYDWWLHASGPVTALALAYTFPANTGWFLEFRAYGQPKSLPVPLLDLQFGGHFLLVLNTDGAVSLFDTRLPSTAPVGAGNIALGKSFLNGDASLMILPYRRGRLLIYSPTLGGYVDFPVTPGADGSITGSCAPMLYSTVTPASALVSLTPLLYPADGVPAIESSAKPLARPLTQSPGFTGSVYDRPGLSLCTLGLVTPYSTGSSIQSVVYSVTMIGNSGHQTAEEQGVIGIAPSTGSASGASVFGGGAYPASLATPFLYLTAIGYPRSLGPREYTSNILTGVLGAKLRLSKDRRAKSFTFVLDNPANITGVGANYTSLKDLQNRRCRAYLTNQALIDGESGAAVAADPDPDTPLIVDYGSRPVLIFDGFGDQPEFLDGVSSRLSIRCQGLRKRLRNYIFFDRPIYDGLLHTSVMADILQRCGFVGATDTEPTGLGLEIICAPSTDTLPSAAPGDEPLFSPAIGTTAEEMIDLLQNYTGWILDDLVPVGSTNSCWYWVPQNYFASSVYLAQGSPNIGESSVYLRGLGSSSVPLADSSAPGAGLGSLVMLGDPAPRQTLEELIANDIYVIGCSDSGSLIIASARDEASVDDRTALNYVGELRTYIFVSQTINSQEEANRVCAVLFTNLSQAQTHLTFALPDYFPQLGIGAPVNLTDYWSAEIDAIEADLSGLNVRRTVITATRLV